MFFIRNEIATSSSLFLILISCLCWRSFAAEIDFGNNSSKPTPCVDVDCYNQSDLKSSIAVKNWSPKALKKTFRLKRKPSNGKLNNKRQINIQQIPVVPTVLPWDCHRDYAANNMNIENVILHIQNVSNNVIQKATIKQGHLSNATYHTRWPQVFKNVIMYNITINNVRIICPNPQVLPGNYVIKSILGVRGWNLSISRFYMFRGNMEGGTIDCIEEADRLPAGFVVLPIVSPEPPPEPTIPPGWPVLNGYPSFRSSNYAPNDRFYVPLLQHEPGENVYDPSELKEPRTGLNPFEINAPHGFNGQWGLYEPFVPNEEKNPVKRINTQHFPIDDVSRITRIIPPYPYNPQVPFKPIKHIPSPTIIPLDNLLPYNITYLPREHYGRGKMYGPTGLFGPYGHFGAFGTRGPSSKINPYDPYGPYGPNGKWGIHGVYGPFGSYGAYGQFGPLGVYKNYPIPPPSETIDPYGLYGLYGPKGPYGPKGSHGPFGCFGAYGTRGPLPGVNPYDLHGPYGPLGYFGPNGQFGAMGPKGLYGPMGPYGPAGAYGAHGLYGPFGPYGAYGPHGPPPGVDPFASNGPYGVCGSHGMQGMLGPTGPYGAHGSLKPKGAVTYGNFTWGAHGWQAAGFENLQNLKLNPRWPPPTYDPFYLSYCSCLKGHKHSTNLSSNLENILQCYKDNKFFYLQEMKFPCPSVSTERCSNPTTTPFHGKSCRTTIICIDSTSCKYITSTCFTTTPYCTTTKPCRPSMLTCITSSICVTTNPCLKTTPCITTACPTTCPITTCPTTTCPTTTCKTTTCRKTKCPFDKTTCGNTKRFLPIKLLGKINFNSNDK